MRSSTAETPQAEITGTRVVSMEERSALVLPKFSVAPMLDWTDRHCRVFLRCYSPRALLYTEMLTSAAVRRGDLDRLLGF